MIDDRTLLNLLSWWSQIALIVAAAAALPRLLKLDDAGTRYAYWRGLLVLCLALPVVEPWQTVGLPVAVAGSRAPSIAGQLAGAMTGDSPLTLPAIAPVTTLSSFWLSRLVAFVAIVAVARLMWLAIGICRLGRLRRDGVAVTQDDVTGNRSSLPAVSTEIRFVTNISQPMTFGVRRPVVCLPEAVQGMSPDIRRVVLAHELWHVRRRDWFWLVAEEAVRSLFWFHPAMQWVVSRVQRSREEVVDELTVLETNARRTYLQALLTFADGPVPFPVTPFARRRHLFYRIQLISREAVMSSKRVVVASAVIVLVVAGVTAYGASRFPLTAIPSAAMQTPKTPPPPLPPPRDPRPGAPRPPTAREKELKASIAADPTKPAAYLEMAKLQEERNATAEAEATLTAARAALPSNTAVLSAVAQFYNRRGDFQRAIDALEQIAALDPSDPARHQAVAVFYWEKAFKSTSLSPGEKLAYIQSGIAATDRAIALNGDYMDALVYKNILLRMQSQIETDPTRQQQLLAEADKLRVRALQLQQNRAGKDLPPPPPPPPPPGAGAAMPDGMAPVRVGGNIKPPTKIKDVRPVYPEEAMASKVTGVVILEATIDPSGRVSDARVLKSVPLLDQAALDAVKQWEFTPTHVNGVPVPVIMTVTVNFSLQ